MISKVTDYIKNFIHRKNNVFPLIYHKHNFIFYINNKDNYPGKKDALIIDPKKIKSIIKYIIKNDIKDIAVNDYYCEKIENIDFLIKTPGIERITILQNNLNLKPLENLVKLKSLSFTETNSKLNLEKFEKLEYLGCDYRKVKNLDKCINLKTVSLHFYSCENLMEMENFKKLENIFLYRTNIINFRGIEDLENITKIELHNAAKLESLIGLPKRSEKLEVIYIYNAKKLINYSNLKMVKKLKRLQLVSGGALENLHIFDNFPELEFLQLGMEVKTGDKHELMKKINGQ